MDRLSPAPRRSLLTGTSRAAAGALLSLVAACGSGSKGAPASNPPVTPPTTPGGPYSLQVNVTGNGKVTGGAIDCGTACSATLASGSMALLVATPAATARFQGWTGCDQDLGLTCKVSLTANRAVSASFAACPSCATAAPTGGLVQADIGPAGGRLAAQGGALVLDVPAGAVAAATTFSIQALENRAPGGRGTAYELLPSGSLAQPVTLTFAFSDLEALGTAPELLGVAYQGTDGAWRRVPATVDAAARTIQATVDHFTVFSVVGALRLNPGVASVGLGGKEVFYLDQCFETVLLSPPTSHLQCDGTGAPSIAGYTVLGWSVNGVSGGSTALGTIGEDADAVALYTAPATAPPGGSVTVSVRLRENATGAVHVLVADVYVGDPYAIVGTLKLTGMGSPTGAGYVGSVDFLQTSILMGLPGALLRIERYEDEFRVCTYEPSTWGLPLLSAVIEPGSSGTYMLGSMHSSLLVTTETCTERSTGEVTSNAFPYGDQLSWSNVNEGMVPQEFPGDLLRPNQLHAGSWVNRDGQGFAWSFMVVPRAGP